MSHRGRAAGVAIRLAMASACLAALAAGAEPCRAQPATGQGAATAGWTTLSVPGTPGGVLEALGLDQNVSRTRLMLEVIRRAHESPDGDAARARAALHDYLSVVAEFERRLPAAGAAPVVVSAARLAASDTRGLESLLEFIGYRLRRRDGVASLEQVGDRGATVRRQRLRAAGVDTEGLAERLATGGEATLELPHFDVPLPLDVAAWRALVGDEASATPLYLPLLTDRRSALFYAGLCSVDDETLRALASSPALLKRLHDDHAAAFAAFGDSLHLRDGVVLPPGDAGAARVWALLAGEAVTETERFVPALFGRDRGRLAYFYQTVSALDPPRQRFALASGLEHPRLRFEQVAALYGVFQYFDPGWQPTARPFTRRPLDPARWLAEVRVSEEGAWLGPRALRLWDRVFAGDDLSSEASRELEEEENSGPFDPAWLAAKIFSGPPVQQQRRFDVTLFSQRVFPGADARDGNLLVALRAFLRYPSLSLTLERLSIGEPAVHASAARRAQALASMGREEVYEQAATRSVHALSSIGGATRRAVAMAQFQAALFLVQRAEWAGAFEQGRARDVVRALISVRPDEDGFYGGRLATWIESVWLPAIGAEATDAEAGLIAALAGARHQHTRPGQGGAPPVLEWEGQLYELDLVTPEVLRIDRLREQQGGNRLDLVLDLARPLAELQADAVSKERLTSLAEALGSLAKSLSMPPAVVGVGAGDLPDLSRTIDQIREDLGRAAEREGKLDPDARRRLGWLADVLNADTLVSIAYAAVLGDPDGPVPRAGHVAARHDLGFTSRPGEDELPGTWETAQSVQGGGRGWFASGSLLLLDLGLAPLGVRRLESEMAPPAGGPGVPGPVLASLARTLALWNAFALDEASRDAIAAALGRGRALVNQPGADPEGLARVLAGAGLEPLRLHQINWAARHEPDEVHRLLALTDLFELGRHDAQGPPSVPQAWSTEAMTRSGCACLAPASVPGVLERGRPASGILGSVLGDVGLRLAEVSLEMKLPPGLARALLAGAVYDFAFDAAPLHEDDWLGLARGVDAITRDRIEEYVAQLTFDGPLTATTREPGNHR